MADEISGEAQQQAGDKTITYILVDWTENGVTSKRLSIQGPSGGMFVKDWQPGQLGITLPAKEDTPPPTGNAFIGDFVKMTDGTKYLIDNNGNYIPAGEQPGAADLIHGTSDADVILGLAGDDALLGRGGDDHIDGGDGNDVIIGGLGADTLIGGKGDDLIYGSSTGTVWYLPKNTDDLPPPAIYPFVLGRGFNWAYSSPGLDQDGYQQGYLSDTIDRDEQFNDDGNVIDAGAGDDVVYAGTGDDVVSGGEGNDDIIGMGGSDILFGDTGDDTLIGGEGCDTYYLHLGMGADRVILTCPMRSGEVMLSS